MREILELPDIQNAEIVDGKVRVETKDNVFVDVMSTVVNIFSRVAGGCELSFVGFAYKNTKKSVIHILKRVEIY